LSRRHRSRYNGYGYGGWAPYVPVAARRHQAERKVAALRKQGRTCKPVAIEGRTITHSFWGKAWCHNLEIYGDFANRLPRGRTYVRSGAVIDLQIAQGKVSALVSGSEIYQVEMGVEALASQLWKGVLKECAGKIDSLVELLQGRLSQAVMEVVTRPGAGLFPTPKQIRFGCTCPDAAYLCKHVAAALYGVGSRLDHQPELLFLLRHVEPQELIRQAGSLPVVDGESALSAEQRLETQDLGSLFGIELDEAPAAGRSPAAKKAPTAAKPPASAEPVGRKTRRSARATVQTMSPVRPAAKRTPRGGRSRSQTVTARQLAARGIPHYTMQNWILSGVLLRTGRRGVYRTTERTEERIGQYLARTGASAKEK
jgi:uncharacterized Zn finger protein